MFQNYLAYRTLARPNDEAVPRRFDDCVRAKEIDSELFRLFREARVYERGAH